MNFVAFSLLGLRHLLNKKKKKKTLKTVESLTHLKYLSFKEPILDKMRTLADPGPLLETHSDPELLLLLK